MRPKTFAMLLAATALVFSAPAFARDGGGHGGRHYSGGGGHGGHHYRGGGGFHGGHYRGNFGYRGYGGFGHRGFYGGPHFGVGFGYPYYGYGGFYDPFFYPPRSTIIVREAQRELPPAFPQSFQPGQGEAPKQSWYFCQDSNQYYPHVRSCASAWQEVPAIPPPPATAAIEGQ